MQENIEKNTEGKMPIMMIAFYSPLHGQTGTTSNLLAVAAITALDKNASILIMQSHFTMNNLEDSLVNKPKQKSVDSLDDYGIDSLIRNRNLFPLSEELIKNSCYSFLDGKLHLLPGTKKINKELYDAESQELLDVMKMAEDYFDYLLVDVNSGRSVMTDSILQQAQLVVVNLSQNPQVMDSYFNHELPKKNVMYLIGNYDRRSRYSIHNLSYLYPDLTKQNTAHIDYNVVYRDAVWEAAVLRFFRKNTKCGKKDENYQFMESVRKASSMLLKKAGEKDV